MQHLIPITRTAIGADTVPTVNARELHTFLEVESRFNDWIARRIDEYDFEEGQDFRSFLSESPGAETKGRGFYSNLSKTPGGRPAKDYLISVNMAKELAMVERNARGKQARQYFIECERMAHTMRIERPALAAPPAPSALADAIRAETDVAMQAMLYQQFQQACRKQRLLMPELKSIIPGGELIPAQLFARAIVAIQRARYAINHSRNPALRAYHYPKISQYSKELGIPLPPKREIYQSLKHDGHFLGERIVEYSALIRCPLLCWVFRRRLDGAPRRG